jgi:hypothetical protein
MGQSRILNHLPRKAAPRGRLRKKASQPIAEILFMEQLGEIGPYDG